MGVGPEFRVGHAVARVPKGDSDQRLLGVAVPEEEVQSLRAIFPDQKPSIVSMEVSGLAALHTFEQTPKARRTDAASVYIEAGNQVTLMSFFVRGELALVRKFEYGSRLLIERIQNLLECDEDSALGVLYDDPGPLLATSEGPMTSFLKQMSVSKQFVEKAEDTKIQAVYASGGLSYSPYWMSQIRGALEAEIEIWNPFTENGITSYPRGVKGVESMFAPSLGAAMSILQAT
jgi:hypothetical protein